MNRLALKALAIAGLSLALGACVAPPTYQWGNYDALLYQSYKNPARTDNLRIALETHIAALEQNKLTVPPGLYAELGTLYLQAGNAPQAVAQYTKERNAWPESRGFMDALIATVSKRASPATGAKQ